MTLYQPITNVHRLYNIIHGIAYIPNHSPHFSIFSFFSFFFMHLFVFLSPVGVYLSNPVCLLCLHQSFMNKTISSNSHILASRSFLPSFLPPLSTRPTQAQCGSIPSSSSSTCFSLSVSQWRTTTAGSCVTLETSSPGGKTSETDH